MKVENIIINSKLIKLFSLSTQEVLIYSEEVIVHCEHINAIVSCLWWLQYYCNDLTLHYMYAHFFRCLQSKANIHILQLFLSYNCRFDKSRNNDSYKLIATFHCCSLITVLCIIDLFEQKIFTSEQWITKFPLSSLFKSSIVISRQQKFTLYPFRLSISGWIKFQIIRRKHTKSLNVQYVMKGELRIKTSLRHMWTELFHVTQEFWIESV